MRSDTALSGQTGIASGDDEDAIFAATHEVFFVEKANEFSKEECLSFGGDLK
ncbi:hypothetical protein [Natronococcus pandeyae]|uniref:hypothetical protein n=1 Tax=Natronococcus pandeyae TaxID=2055836 RepID=UPI00165317D7|nr:hypothetical protein [Natronococcus pandeyae]